ncbi:hypothetical protein L6R29_19170 [Myxococcota bacterium]|nr:hypothetical protein [Myxococcota bacterium]
MEFLVDFDLNLFGFGIEHPEVFGSKDGVAKPFGFNKQALELLESGFRETGLVELEFVDLTDLGLSPEFGQTQGVFDGGFLLFAHLNHLDLSPLLLLNVLFHHVQSDAANGRNRRSAMPHVNTGRRYFGQKMT